MYITGSCKIDTYITDDWIDRYPQMYCWRGYTDEVDGHIKDCVERYRYTGSFLGYLFKTLEYSIRGKPPLVSLNDNIFGDKSREEYAKEEEDWQIYIKLQMTVTLYRSYCVTFITF